MTHADFESHEDEQPVRQAHWRLLAAVDYFSIGVDMIWDREPDQTPDDILRYVLFNLWQPDSSFPRDTFLNFSERAPAGVGACSLTLGGTAPCA